MTFPFSAPTSVDLDAVRLERARQLLDDWCHEQVGRAATLLVARRGVVVAEYASGDFQPLGETSAPLPTQPDTIFLAASLTKPMVAALAMQLVEQGRLMLDEPVAGLLDGFEGEDRAKVRIRHLLTHTSGLPDMLPNNRELREAGASLDDFAAEACKTPLLYAPGKECRYQSMGFLLLDRVIQQKPVSLEMTLYFRFNEYNSDISD